MRTAILGVIAIALSVASSAGAQNEYRAAEAWWAKSRTFQSQRYDVRTDMTPEQAEPLARHMDLMFDHYSRVLAGHKPRKELRLQLLLFDRVADYTAVMDAKFDAEPANTSGICVQDRSDVALAVWKEFKSAEQVKHTLQHEGFHQFARSLFPGMPSWADEGLAEIFEAALVLPDQVIFGEVDPGRLSMLRQAAQGGRLIPIDKLLAIDAEDWIDHVNAGEGSLQYAQAWSLVHFLLYGEGGRHQQAFGQFLTALNDRQSWQTAFLRAFGTRDFQALEQRWLASLKDLRPSDFRETWRRLDFLAAGLAALHEKGLHPATMDELKAQLRDLGFSHTTAAIEPPRALRATDDAVFAMPMADPQAAGAAFVLVDFKPPAGKGKAPAKRTSRSRKDTPAPEPQASPFPLRTIHTQGLAPLNLGVVWEKDSGGAMRYRIVTQ